jgi:glycosyltransferase involved in cell wall biosynthesis
MQSVKRKTVVFVESAAAMGGVQFSTLYLAQNLDRTQWHPIVLCPEEGDLTRACGDAGIETYVLAQPRLWSTSVRIRRGARLPNPFAWAWDAYVMSLAARRLKRFFRQAAPDLVVTKGLSSHFSGGWAARKLGIPCVWHVQDLISERNFGIYRRAFALAARWLPQHIIVDGIAIKRQLPVTLQARVSVVHNGIDTRVFRPGLDGSAVREELGIPKDQLVIGHAGRLTPWKGQHYLIEAFARIADDQPNVSLLLAGSPVFDNDSYQQRLLKLTTQFALHDRIKFAGYRHDLPNVLAAMDIFAFTSIEKDTSPLALLSAMSCGLPIVAFDIDGVEELVASDQCLLTPAGRIDGLADSLGRLIADEDLRHRFGSRARQLAVEELSLDLYTGRIEEIFLELSGGANVNGGDPGILNAPLASIQNEAFHS